jgi:hypothetical protein
MRGLNLIEQSSSSSVSKNVYNRDFENQSPPLKNISAKSNQQPSKSDMLKIKNQGSPILKNF